MVAHAYQLTRPVRRTTSVIFASPHSGRHYPDDFLRRVVLDQQSIRSSEDAFVDRLFSTAPGFGAPFLAASAPRAFVDLNRAAEELDPALIEGVRRVAHNPRVASGLGVIPRVVANGRSIYRGRIALAEAQDRVLRYWRPYHDMLQSLIDESHAQFGEAILIDCHSMPHEALESLGPAGGKRPEVVLGDRFGAAAASGVIDRIEAIFTDAGLRTVRNMPFAGAFIAQHYGRPSRRQHVIQIEIDRALYMDERRIEPLPEFDAFRRLMTSVVAELASVGRPREMPLAAE